MAVSEERILLHTARGNRRAVDPREVAWLESSRGGTRVHLKGAKPLLDIRPIGAVARVFEPRCFLRIHRNHMVNLLCVREIRRRAGGRDWEIRLEPPASKALPVGREALLEVWHAFGEG